MKILVTGGAGFIGSNFLHYETSAYPNDKFVCLDALTYAGNYNNIKSLYLSKIIQMASILQIENLLINYLKKKTLI